MTRVGIVQIDPHLGDTEHNLHLIERHLRMASDRGVEIAVFPECAVTGYLFESLEEAMLVAEEIPGPSSERLQQYTQQSGVFAVVGMLERVEDRCYNTAVLAGPNGIEAVYRKTHTLCLGVDRFTTPGDLPYQVVDLPAGRVGMLICYDLRFPEPARLLALQGTHMILLPTNWPQSSTIQPDVYTRARAAENRIFVLAADRVGEERGTRFLGRSQVVGPDGTVLAEGSRTSPEMLVVDIDPLEAETKNVVVRAGQHEMDCIADRRPDLYGGLVRDMEPAYRR